MADEGKVPEKEIYLEKMSSSCWLEGRRVRVLGRSALGITCSPCLWAGLLGEEVQTDEAGQKDQSQYLEGP